MSPNPEASESELVQNDPRPDGILNVDKPSGMTSHDVVAQVRHWTGQRKIGHAGTLDPMATGVLLLCLGRATRVAEYLMQGIKQYRAVIRLGVSTDTYDADGTVTETSSPLSVELSQIVEALGRFQNKIEQVPPPYSAVRISGRRLHSLARKGIMVEAPARTVEIHAIDVKSWHTPDLTLEVTCSPGTYIRSLAHDLGRILGVGGHLAALARIASGSWRIEDSISLDRLQMEIRSKNWTQRLFPVDAALQGFERVDLNTDDSLRVKQGQDITIQTSLDIDLIRAYTSEGEFLALLESTGDPGTWHPKKVFCH